MIEIKNFEINQVYVTLNEESILDNEEAGYGRRLDVFQKGTGEDPIISVPLLIDLSTYPDRYNQYEIDGSLFIIEATEYNYIAYEFTDIAEHQLEMGLLLVDDGTVNNDIILPEDQQNDIYF